MLANLKWKQDANTENRERLKFFHSSVHNAAKWRSLVGVQIQFGKPAQVLIRFLYDVMGSRSAFMLSPGSRGPAAAA